MEIEKFNSLINNLLFESKQNLISSLEIEEEYLKIQTYCLTNQNITTAGISCYNKNIVEGLELVINISFTEKNKYLDANIYCTDGSLLTEINEVLLEKEISTDELSRLINKFLDRVFKEEFQIFIQLVEENLMH